MDSEPIVTTNPNEEEVELKTMLGSINPDLQANILPQSFFDKYENILRLMAFGAIRTANNIKELYIIRNFTASRYQDFVDNILNELYYYISQDIFKEYKNSCTFNESILFSGFNWYSSIYNNQNVNLHNTLINNLGNIDYMNWFVNSFKFENPGFTCLVQSMIENISYNIRPKESAKLDACTIAYRYFNDIAVVIQYITTAADICLKIIGRNDKNIPAEDAVNILPPFQYDMTKSLLHEANLNQFKKIDDLQPVPHIDIDNVQE